MVICRMNTLNYFSGVTLLVRFSSRIIRLFNLNKMSQLKLKIFDQLIRNGTLKSQIFEFNKSLFFILSRIGTHL